MPESWRNLASGHAGSIPPRATLVGDTGHFCRRCDEMISLADGRITILTKTACRDACGSCVWVY